MESQRRTWTRKCNKDHFLVVPIFNFFLNIVVFLLIHSSISTLERKIAQTNSKIEKSEREMKTKEDLKTVALGTSKINYCDPRISVAWCKRHEVPIEKVCTVFVCPCFYIYGTRLVFLSFSR